MKTLITLMIGCALCISITDAEPSLADLEKQFEKALGPEWTVAKDLQSFVAIRRDVKLLNMVSRIDPILGEENPWDSAFSSDYIISITVRPKMSVAEYAEMDRKWTEWIQQRTSGLHPSTKKAHRQRRLAEAVLILPDFHLGDHDIYISSTDQGIFHVRPEAVIV